MSLFLALGATAQSYLVGNKVTDVQTGYYVVVGTFNPGNRNDTKTGPVYYDNSITGTTQNPAKKYRLDQDWTIPVGETLTNGNYVWYVENNGTTITLKNVQDDVYFVKDGEKNQNFTGTETANLTLKKVSADATESKFYLHLADYTDIGYVHCNTPGGDPCLSYWPSHGVTASTSVRFEFYKVEVDLSAPAIIDDYYNAGTTFDTYSGTISNIINGNRSDKWWSNGAQEVDKTITVVLNKVYQVGDIKWYFHNGDKPQGAAIERRGTDDGEWSKVADFTINDIENNIFTCNAAGADVKELRLRITTAHANWLQVSEVELYEFIEEGAVSVREAFNTAYTAAAEVIAASGFSVTEAWDLPLQTTNPNEAYYIWTNAQEPTEGPISQLVDGNTGNKNFFHTQWSDPVPAGPHYIEVDLGEDCDLDEFIIRYSTRINSDGSLADFPDAIEIMGSKEKNGTYTCLATFNEDLPQGQGLNWESAVVENNGYRFLRFNVTAENVFWHMSEFDITKPASVSVNEGYEDLVDEIAVLKEAYDNASNYADYGYNEYVEATNALTAALAMLSTNADVTYHFVCDGVTLATQTVSVVKGNDYPAFDVTLPLGYEITEQKPEGTVTATIVEEIAVVVNNELLPFEVAATVDEITTWYYAQMHAFSGYHWFVAPAADGESVKTQDHKFAAEETDTHLWGFIGSVKDGFMMVNKATHQAIKSDNSGVATMASVADATAFVAMGSQAGGNWFCLRYPEGHYLNTQSQGSESLDDFIINHWSDNDNGSSFCLTEYVDEDVIVVVSEAGWATKYFGESVYVPAGVNAYIITGVENGWIVKSQIAEGEVIPANTGVLLENKGEHKFAETVSYNYTLAGNLMSGSVENAYIEGTAYVLANHSTYGVGFYKAELNKNATGGEGNTHFLNNAGKAYFTLPATVSSAAFYGFDWVGTTGIDEVKGESGNVKGEIYDLTGRRIEAITAPGIYIANGRKVLVK